MGPCDTGSVRIRPFLLVPAVIAVVLIAGCAKPEASHVQYGPPVTTEPSPERTVTAAIDAGLTCTDELGDVYSDPGFDIDQVAIAVNEQRLTATFTVGQLAYEQTANTEFLLTIDPTGDGDALSLSGWLPWSGPSKAGQWTSNGGDRDVAGGSVSRSGSEYTAQWPRDALVGDIPIDFTWRTHVIYDQDKHDSCPGGRDVNDESMHGSWAVSPKL